VTVASGLQCTGRKRALRPARPNFTSFAWAATSVALPTHSFPAALGAFAEIVKGELSSGDEDRLRGELLLYCGRDTLALLEFFRALSRGLEPSD
jgi:hypothetical protein